MKIQILALLCISLIAQKISFAADSSQVYFQKGLEEKTAKRYLVASGYFEKAIVFNAKFVQAHLEDGFVNLEMRRMDAAKAAFTKVYELDPGNSKAIEQLAEIYYAYNQFQKAIEFASRCKNYPNAERIIAMSNYRTEDFGAAVTGLASYLAKNPKDAEGYYSLGRSYYEMEEADKAFPFYQKAVELDNTKYVWIYETGLLAYDINNYKEAIKYFNDAAAAGYPESNDFTETLGYSYIYNGDFAKGETLLLKILAKKPGDKEMLRDIAEVYYKAKMYDKSLEYCQKLLEINAKDGKALWQAGLCFQKKGQKDRGQQMCDMAIQMDPSLAGMRQKSMMSAGL
jgi:tetratricopeptide (TPR) repeat protein